MSVFLGCCARPFSRLVLRGVPVWFESLASLPGLPASRGRLAVCLAPRLQPDCGGHTPFGYPATPVLPVFPPVAHRHSVILSSTTRQIPALPQSVVTWRGEKCTHDIPKRSVGIYFPKCGNEHTQFVFSMNQLNAKAQGNQQNHRVSCHDYRPTVGCAVSPTRHWLRGTG